MGGIPMAELRFHDVDNHDVSRLIDILAGYKVDVILTPETLSFEELDKEPPKEMTLFVDRCYLIDGRPYFFLDVVDEQGIRFLVFEDDYGSIFSIEEQIIINYHIVEREDIKK